MIFSYKETTHVFGDLLLEYAATIPVPTKDSSIYIKTAGKLMKDPRYIQLMKSLQKN
jgi:hypothetical protein